MNSGQRFLLRAVSVAVVASVGLLIYYNLSPNYVADDGLLVEEFWALGLASFGFVGSVLGFAALVIWLGVSSLRRRN